MKTYEYICGICDSTVSISDRYCPECGSLFDEKSSGVSLRVTKQDVDTVTAFLNVLLKNRVVFKDVMRYMRSLSKSYGVSGLDSLDLTKTVASIFDMGDGGVSPYPYKMKKGGNVVEATFESKSGFKYLVTLRNVNMFLDVDFSVEGDNPYIETNKGDALKVMSTIRAVVEEYLDKNKEIRGLRYNPQSKGGDGSLGSGDIGSGRDRLYKAFISKNRKVEYVKQGATVFVIFKD